MPSTLCALLALATAGQAEQPQPARTSEDSLRDGIAWLVANQRPDGAFGTFESSRVDEVWLGTQASHRAFQGATTALCAMALIEPVMAGHEEAAKALDRAVRWSLAQPVVGKASGSAFYDTWTHTYLIEMGAALLRAHALPQLEAEIRALLQREVDVALSRQAADGGWGYYDFEGTFERASGMETTSFNTAAMLLAFLAAREQGAVIPQGRAELAVARLKRFRLPDGAFVYGTYADLRPGVDFNRPRGTSGRLQSCNLALHRWDAGVDEAMIAKGLAHLRDHHHYIESARGRPIPHEAFYRNSGYYYFFGHYYAACNIGTLSPGAEREAFASWLDGVMRGAQSEDGSWFDYPLYGYGKAYGTAFGVLTMQRLAAQRAEARSAASSDQKPG